MVFHTKAMSTTKRFNYQDNPWDTSSIGSTVSSDFDMIRSKNDLEKAIYDIHHEWHVVPSGGSKARSAYSDKQPHPCRYDEYANYLPPEKKEERSKQEQPYDTERKPNGINLDSKSIVRKNGETTSNKSRGKRYIKQHAADGWKHLQVGDELSKGNSQHKENSKTSRNKNNHKYTEETDADNNEGENSNKDNSNKGEEKTTETTTNKEAETNGEKGMIESDTGDNGGEDHTNKNTNGKENKDGKEDGEENGKDDDGTKASGPGHDKTVMQTFTVEFNIRSIPANKIGFIHKEFIKEILTVAPFTIFEASNKRTTPAPTNITKIEQFPSNHLLHQKFFHRLDIREKVKYTHHVYSPVSVIDIKRRALPFLQEHNIGMWNDEISNNSKVRVCWILNAHSRVTYKPTMKDKLCIGINQQQANYGDDNKRLLTQLPKRMHDIDLYTKTVTHQGHQTEAVCVMAYKPAAPVIRELVGMLDHAYLGNGTSIVSDAAVRELDGDKYSQIINENTAFHQNTRTISVKFFHDMYWNQKYRPCKEANYTTIREWVMTGSGVVSIERTKDTESEGRYIILCKSEGFPAFKRILQVMCQSLVKTIEENDELRALALEKYQQYPTIIGPHKIGRYAEQNAKGLLSRIDAPTVPKPSIKRISTKIEFDFGSAEGFPVMQSGILTRRNNMKRNQKQQTWATVAAPAVLDNSNNSVASEQSETGKSMQSVRTGITNSEQTLQSEALSVLTDFISQARQEDAERRREEKEERKLEREERKAEAVTRQRNEETRQRNEERRDESNRLMFQSMMALMTQNNNNGHTSVHQMVTTTDPETRKDTGREASNIENLNKKRKNGDETTLSETEVQVQQQRQSMDVETNVMQPNQQNHDPIQEEQDLLLH